MRRPLRFNHRPPKKAAKPRTKMLIVTAALLPRCSIRIASPVECEKHAAHKQHRARFEKNTPAVAIT
jgi:hypothetical protein